MTDKMSARDERFYDAGLEFGIAKVASLENQLARVRNTTDWQAEKLRHLRGVLQDIELLTEELLEDYSRVVELAHLIAGKAQAARAASRVPTTTEMREWAVNEAQQRAQNVSEGRTSAPDLSNPQVVEAIFEDARKVVKSERKARSKR